MYYSARTLLSTLIFAALQPFTSGTWIPFHNHRQKNVEVFDGASVQVTLPDFGDLAKQFAGISTVSVAQIHEILDLLAAYEQSTLTMVNKIVVADGVDPASAIPSLLPAATTHPSLISAAGSFSPPALDRRPPFLNCPSPSPSPSPSPFPSLLTTTLLSTSTITETATVTGDPSTTTETITISASATSLQPTTALAPAQILPSTAQPSSAAAASQQPAQPSTPPYTFNATCASNIAVYFGQMPATASTSLEAQCADPNPDIVILAFVIGQLDGGLYPSINFGSACSGQTPWMASKAPGLLSCLELAANIMACQRGYGKKVLISVGGGE